MGENHPDVELRIPADSAYLAVLRTATAGLAARLDFTLDDIEDLRIAVTRRAPWCCPGAGGLRPDLRVRPRASKLTVAVTAECDSPRPPEPRRVRMDVLAALTNEVAAESRRDKAHGHPGPRHVRPGVGVRRSRLSHRARPDRQMRRQVPQKLFDELRAEGADEAERSRLRDELVRLHLPLVEHFARRFLNRASPSTTCSRSARSG